VGGAVPGEAARDETDKMLILSGANAPPTATLGTPGSVVTCVYARPSRTAPRQPGRSAHSWWPT